MKNRREGVAAAAFVVCLLCGAWPLAAGPVPIKLKKIFSPDQPVALLRIHKLDATHAEATMISLLRAWPFPYVGPSGEVGGGQFTCAGQLRISAASGATRETATGTRTLYFQSVARPVSFADPDSFSAGQKVAVDSLSMRIEFSAGFSTVRVEMTSHQLSGQPFQFKGQQIIPPAGRMSAETFEGSYSQRFGGYLLKASP